MKIIKSFLFLIPVFLISCATQSPLPVNPVYLTNQNNPEYSASNETEYSNISGILNQGLYSIIPQNPTNNDKLIFKSYKVGIANPYNDNWLSRFDFSGVTWDNKRASTLISPQHVVMAKHYQRNIGDTLNFEKNNKIYSAKLIGKVNTTTDITVGLLDKPIYEVANYPVLAPGYNWQKILGGTTVFVTDQERKCLLYNISFFSTSINGSFAARGTNQLDPLFRENLISGDSGNPVFLAYGNNQLILLSTNWFGGAGMTGPDLSLQELQTQIYNAVLQLNSTL